MTAISCQKTTILKYLPFARADGSYTKAFSTFLPFGAVAVLLTGPVFQAIGVIRTMMLFEACTLLYMVPALIDNLPVQYLTFMTVSALRPFRFAVISNTVNSLYVFALYNYDGMFAVNC